MIAETWKHYWILKEQCSSKGKHKFRDNKFGITVCLVCGLVTPKACGVDIKEGETIITNRLK